MKFSHLHNHTQYSLLDGAASIPRLFEKAKKDEMPAMAITDHGNMFGVFEFVATAWKDTKVVGTSSEGKELKEPVVKPIVGCEFYLVSNRQKREFRKSDGEKDKRYHQLLLAKNETGYKNLVKLCSLGYIEGMYGKYPRIDKELLLQHHEGLIATTCCLGAEVPQTILQQGEAAGEKVFQWWLEVFGEDYYVELQRHDIPDQIRANESLVRFARKYQVPIIASNDSHYVDREDYNAHDILLCINTGEKQSTEKYVDGEDDDLARNKRFAFYNDQFYFKNTTEMNTLFADLPEAIDNTGLIVDKVKALRLERDILLPHYEVPAGYDMDSWLEHLAWQGAHKRYPELSAEIEERIRFELFTIRTMGFAGYFLIVQDFINHGKDIGVFVGPGRGSAAGSVVAYCIGITNIDPIKYKLLFERFLNPERKSMPDIDTDFDDAGRQKVIDYVVHKYGSRQVAQIVTYGTMAAKSSIKDVARVLDLPLAEANALAKLVSDKPGISLKRLLHAPMKGENSLVEKESISAEDILGAERLREIYAEDSPAATVLHEAEKLEGTVRNTGIHAAGIIIAPGDLTELIPVATAKDSELVVTQFGGNVIENAGVIKMDFLGLRTLSILKDAIELIRRKHQVLIDLDQLPLDDLQTFELYQRGDTNGTFQFESVGMQKYLRELKPTVMDDLIAMNALYRPGPIAYIPQFIRRKHGEEPIEYDLPEMEEFLAETYGVTVYQEQVMLLSQKLGGFSKGDADVLRKAMGKKQKAVLDKMKGQFIQGAMAKGHPEKTLEKIWTDWEAFAQYAFNKSHSVCYAMVAYQTAYLKAHYPAEYMAAVLNNAGSIDKIRFFMEECQRMELNVSGPDVNESLKGFTVGAGNSIRFGMNAVKGVGEAAVEDIIKEREANGPFSSVFDFISRINPKSVNKKTLESLVLSGTLDSFKELHRAQYFFAPGNDPITGLERLTRFANQVQGARAMTSNSLFGAGTLPEIKPPLIPDCEPWNISELLEREKEMIGIYLSAHPLDGFRFELQHYGILPLSQLDENRGKTVRLAGYISDSQQRLTKKGTKFGSFQLNDYSGQHEFTLWEKDYLKYHQFLENGQKLLIQGMWAESKYRPDRMEFSIQKISLLSTVRHNLTKRITLFLTLNSLDLPFVTFLSKCVQENPGECELSFCITDETLGQELRLSRKNSKFYPCDELVDYLMEHQLQYSLELH
ncbi:MAG: DNA polymerase III subunit alpha [Bacteroidetes bacterium]|nr:DNA polymerase III subunit alpha [Bacteroidota bacterium]MBS1630860.1 DNA polymerase III subunit alpha [Bacteroidota bacterium]